MTEPESADNVLNTGVEKDPTEGAGVPEFYVNSVSFESSYYDTVLSFAITRQGAPLRPLVRLRMAPQHELIMLSFLLNHWASYVRTFGEIRVPPEGARILEIAEAIETIREFATGRRREEQP